MAETQAKAYFSVEIISLDPNEEPVTAEDVSDAIEDAFTDDGYMVSVLRTGTVE